METYNDIVLGLERIKTQPVTPDRTLDLTVLKEMVMSISLGMRALKFKTPLQQKSRPEGYDWFGLNQFFGNNDPHDHELKLLALLQKLREIKAQDKTALANAGQ